jgi:Ca2+-binding RTX toxin-like protein
MPTITGTSNGESLTGTSGDDQIFGLGGNDVLIGAGGNDTTDGGEGNDQHIVDSAGDVVVERPGEGDDEVITSVSFALGDGTWVETLRTADAWSTLALSLIGNEIAQSIYGNAGANVLNCGGGNDYLVGLEGNDYLIGGAGADVMLGGTGNDTYTIDLAVGDVVTYQPGSVIGPFGGKIATVVDPGDGQTITILVDGQTLTVDVGRIWGADKVLESAGEGDDVVVASASYLLPNDISIETLVVAASAGGVALIGNDSPNSLYGNDANNALLGGLGDDFLVGGGGSDRLDGGSGVDVMAGGIGDDTYVVGQVADRIIEAVGQGTDRVETTTSYTLAPGVEVEVFASTAISGVSLNGNEFTQQIIGGGSSDRISSGGGADILDGRGNSDTYYVSDGRETIAETTNDGTNDTVFVSTDYTLNAGAQVETISTYWQFGDQDFDITGNEFGQLVVGNYGSNTLDGAGGNDTLVGLGGADTFAFTTALGSGNVDTIADFESGIDTIALSSAIFSALPLGDLDPEAFATGTAATEADDRIIYDPTTGNLFYDADGSGAGAAVMFAHLNDSPTVQATDFSVI